MILIIGVLGSGKSNVLLDLIKHQQKDIDKICLNLKDPLKSKSQLLIKRREKKELKDKTSKSICWSFTNYYIDNVYENLEDYNPTKKKSASSGSWYDNRYGS